jgi:hypothetical protein
MILSLIHVLDATLLVKLALDQRAVNALNVLLILSKLLLILAIPNAHLRILILLIMFVMHATLLAKHVMDQTLQIVTRAILHIALMKPNVCLMKH